MNILPINRQSESTLWTGYWLLWVVITRPIIKM